MDHTLAQLSAAATTLGELTDRIEQLAVAADQDKHEALAIDLYEVERALRMAERRLNRLRTGLA